MKKINQNTIEQALLMYKENVSPSQDYLKVIFSQIPEQKKFEVGGRAVRSPYRWVFVAQLVTVCSIMLAIVPTLTEQAYMSDPYYMIDKQIESFEAEIDQQDYNNSLLENR